MNRSHINLIVVGVIILVLLAVSMMLVDIVTVEGNEVGVMETWGEGVVPQWLPPKTYVLIPGFMKRIFKYDVSSQVFVMNDVTGDVEFARGRERDSYLVQSREGQDMRISLNVRWRLDEAKIVDLHMTVRGLFEEKLLRPAIMRVVKDEATTRTAIEAYSGDGLVQLQTDIFNALSSPSSELRQRGILIENFVLETIGLDREYVGEIKSRQVAIQRELRAREETKAALAEAERAKAEAQAAFEKAVVDAKRDKEVGILEFQKKAEQEVLSAEAQKKKTVLDAEASAARVELAAGAEKTRLVLLAEGEKEAAMLNAQAIEAIGKAEAEATRLKLSAYSAQGADAFIRVEVARHMSEAFKNISGYLPQDMKVNLLSESFLKAVGMVADPQQKVAGER